MFKQLSGSSGNILGFKISEDVTGEDVGAMSRIVSETIAAKGKVQLLIEIEGFRHMEPEALLEKLRFVREHAGEIKRMAVVSNRVWIKSWVRNGGLVAHTEVEHFDSSETDAAWQWIRNR